MDCYEVFIGCDGTIFTVKTRLIDIGVETYLLKMGCVARLFSGTSWDLFNRTHDRQV